MRYEVQGIRGAMERAALHLDAADAADAQAQARAQGLTVVSVRRERAGRHGWSTRRPFALELFAGELIALLGAGLNALEALELLARKGGSPAQQAVVRRLLDELRAGRSLSWALAQAPQAFPPLFVAAVRASETTGNLREALQRFLGYREQLDRVRRRVVSASVYPLVLLGVGVLVSLFMLVYVVPRFSQVYDGLGQELPLLSRWLMRLGQALHAHALDAALALAAAIAAATAAWSRLAWRQALLARLWRLPQLGPRLHVYQLGRLYRTLGMLLDSGVPVVAALEMSAGMLPAALQAPLARAVLRIREGQPLSQALQDNGLTTPVALGLLQVGERTGRIAEMTTHVAGLCEDDMARWVEWFVRLFEPLLMVFIGLAIGAIVLLLYMPVFELAGSVQ